MVTPDMFGYVAPAKVKALKARKPRVSKAQKLQLALAHGRVEFKKGKSPRFVWNNNPAVLI
jgi:hypothetical protein